MVGGVTRVCLDSGGGGWWQWKGGIGEEAKVGWCWKKGNKGRYCHFVRVLMSIHICYGQSNTRHVPVSVPCLICCHLGGSKGGNKLSNTKQ